MRMTIEAYQALYCSSVAFGMRKALQAEQGKSDLFQDVEILKAEKLELEHQIIELKQKAEQAERRAAETRLAEERKHTEEIAFLKKTNLQLKVRCVSLKGCDFIIVVCVCFRLNWKELLRPKNNYRNIGIKRLV